MREILKKIRKVEIRIRKEIKERMQGDFHSVFKGSGLEFEEVREYKYGDDARLIDWNVSAKGHGTFIKTFKEEKEQQVFLLVDLSGSQERGAKRQKQETSKELCAVLALAAVREYSTVGLLGYTDQKEIYINADKGLKHAYSLIIRLFKVKVSSTKTDLTGFFRYTLNLLKRKSIIIIISDFLDEGYEPNLTAITNKHDVVVIQVYEKREVSFPPLGIIPVFDREAKKTIWVNTSSEKFRKGLQEQFREKQKSLESLCRKSGANYLAVEATEDYLPNLIRLFRHRKTRYAGQSRR